MIYDVRTVKRVRTDEEKRRRHIYGDKGERFSAKRATLGNDFMTCITTAPDKDNLIFEIQWT